MRLTFHHSAHSSRRIEALNVLTRLPTWTVKIKVKIGRWRWIILWLERIEYSFRELNAHTSGRKTVTALQKLIQETLVDATGWRRLESYWRFGWHIESDPPLHLFWGGNALNLCCSLANGGGSLQPWYFNIHHTGINRSSTNLKVNLPRSIDVCRTWLPFFTLTWY